MSENKFRQQKIQWANDYMHHAQTGNPMQEWVFKRDGQDYWENLNTTVTCIYVLDTYPCRRKLSQNPPLTQPLDNINQIKNDLDEMHNHTTTIKLVAHALTGVLSNPVNALIPPDEAARLTIDYTEAVLDRLNNKE